MRCKDFLALQTDFRDGIITDPSMDRRMRRHQARCRPCSRHVQALALGTRVLRELEQVEPSDRFRVNLRVRMALANRRQIQRPPIFGWPARAAATLLVVTGVLAGFAQKRDQDNPPTPTRVVYSTPGDIPNRAIPRPVSTEFQLPAFHQQMGNTSNATPRVTFTISEDSGYFAVPVTFSR